MELSDKNRYTKVVIEDIVFLTGDDYDSFQVEKENYEELYGDFDEIKYLLQWYYSSEGMENKYNVSGLNTPFLGKLIKIEGYKGYFLYSKNSSLEYIGLSRVVRFEHSEPVKHWTDKFTQLLNVRAK